MAAKKVHVLRVTARRESFRRAGYQFGASPVDVPVKDLKREQIEAIKSDPMLVVVETEAEVGGETVEA